MDKFFMASFSSKKIPPLLWLHPQIYFISVHKSGKVPSLRPPPVGVFLSIPLFLIVVPRQWQTWALRTLLYVGKWLPATLLFLHENYQIILRLLLNDISLIMSMACNWSIFLGFWSAKHWALAFASIGWRILQIVLQQQGEMVFSLSRTSTLITMLNQMKLLKILKAGATTFSGLDPWTN